MNKIPRTFFFLVAAIIPLAFNQTGAEAGLCDFALHAPSELELDSRAPNPTASERVGLTGKSPEVLAWLAYVSPIPRVKLKLNEPDSPLRAGVSHFNRAHPGVSVVLDGVNRVFFLKTIGTYNGRGHAYLTRAARIFMALNAAGLGPKFYGIAKINGASTLVFEHIPIGLEVRASWRTTDLVVQPSALQEMRATGRFLGRLGISNPADLQFIISEDGSRAFLIDPDWFEWQPWGNFEDRVNDDVERLIRRLSDAPRDGF